MSLAWARFPSLDASSPPDAHSCASHKKVERKLGLGGRLSFTTSGSNKWRWSACLNTRWAPPPPTTEVRLAQFCIFPATSSCKLEYFSSMSNLSASFSFNAFLMDASLDIVSSNWWADSSRSLSCSSAFSKRFSPKTTNYLKKRWVECKFYPN